MHGYLAQEKETVKYRHWPTWAAVHTPNYSLVKKCLHGELKIILLLLPGQPKLIQKTGNGTEDTNVHSVNLGLFVLCRLLSLKLL